MKYPQLVSPRAVNAISDWLVSRLEQLGVESPQIYTRLLLSLLQSSVQVNDPIEFSNLEAFFANRKGGHSKRFHLPSDTETLKKLNAVQCLREIVSNEQETAAIERLVEELCDKLKDIEKRTQELNDEERFLIDNNLNIEPLAQNTGSNSHLQQQQLQSSGALNQRHHLYHNLSSSSSSGHIASLNDHSRRDVNDIDNDPKKRYFRAFPALSKEMEDSFRIWRRNAKSLTWPVVGRSPVVAISDSNRAINSITSSSCASPSLSSSNLYAHNNSGADKVLEKKLKGDHLEEFNTHNNKLKEIERSVAVVCDSVVGGIGATIGGDVVIQGTAVGAAASAKKKSKRRRNQVLCKGKPIQTLRKPTVGSGNTSHPSAGGGTKFYSHHRNSSPAWDTDFKGCWEMGPDLIKEFLARQKGASKRSRSNSDNIEAHEVRNEYKMLNEMPKGDELLGGIERPLMKRYIDISFCCDDDERHNCDDVEDGVDYVDEDYDDDYTLASIEELASGTCNARRLYQREGNLQKPLVVCNVIDEHSLDETSESVDHLDFANFKAKFNSSVEALWKDVEPVTTSLSTAQGSQVDNGGSVGVGTVTGNNPIGISSAFYANTSLNALAPFKQDLWNFWSNYNQHHYDQVAKFSTTASTSSMITTRLDDSSASSGAGADIANSSDYFSMPSNLDDFDKSVGAMRRVNEAGASMGAHTPSINVFLQNSIWSSSGDCVDAVGAVGETDESFLFKVWHSNKKLSQIDVGNNKHEKIATLMSGDADNGATTAIGYNNNTKGSVCGSVSTEGTGAILEFPPYNSLKWSEGINAGPAYNSLRHTNAAAEMEGLNKDEGKFVAFGSTVTATGATWEAPAYGQNAQPDLKSWCASNPMSLTEMYGNDVCDSITQENDAAAIDDVAGPEVTLPNHCATTSGFIAYARIKQSGIIQPQVKPLPQQHLGSSAPAHLSNDYFRGGEEENLLTSERTHFHPIETYVDGHTFDISSALDSIEFERSASGYLCYESNEYLEYTRNDIYLADEEVANTNLMNFAATASSQVADGRIHVAKEKPESREMFVLKFRLKRSGEMACQTEDIDFQLAAAKMADQLPAIESVDMSMFPSSTINTTAALTPNRQANNEAIMAAVTKAVAAAAKAAAEQGLHARQSSLSWVPAASRNDCTQSWVQDVSLCDEVDFCRATASAEQLSQYWSMQEVEKQCHQRRLPNAFHRADLERNDDSSMDNSSHTLWGMCAVCNSCDYGKSLPANRLLRDELKLEADEIMSDLRYMQDLYIGETADSVADNAVNEEDELERNSEILNNIGNEINAEDRSENAVDSVQASMLLKVNQLIEDLLRPEQTGKLIRAKFETEEVGADVADEINSSSNKKIVNDWAMNIDDDAVDNSNSWHFGGGSGLGGSAGGVHEQLSNIWQHESQNIEVAKEIDAERKFVCMKPMKLLRQVGGSLNEEDLYLDKLNWEHENLARIWQRGDVLNEAPPSAAPAAMLLFPNEEKPIRVQGNKAIESCIDGNSPEEQQSKDVESQEIVERKNLKNLQNIRSTPPSTASNNAATYKRVQNFLNSSAAKLKLAANRKRRHSASQNFYHQYQQQNLYNKNSASYNNNNNNNDNITDLNRYKPKLAATGSSSSSNAAATEELLLPQEPKQTIITCKYWTTSTNGTQASMDSAAAAMILLAAAANKTNVGIGGGSGGGIMTATSTTANYEDTEDINDEGIMLEDTTFGNTFSCLIDKNASILKHVTMMTRPLTR